MNSFLLSLGSNLPYPESEEQILRASSKLFQMLPSIRFSSIYQTKGEGTHRVNYSNCVAFGETDWELEKLECEMKQLEIGLGRNENCRKQNIVPIDLDVVRFNSLIVRPNNLKMNFMKPGLSELGL